MNSDNFKSDGNKIYYSGVDRGKRCSEGSRMVRNNMAKSIMHFAAVTDSHITTSNVTQSHSNICANGR